MKKVEPDEQHIQNAASALRDGKLVAFPTETVYGLGADATNPVAVEKIFSVKKRPSSNPLIVHVSGAKMAQGLVRIWPEAAKRLVESFWPGPLTLILPKNDAIPGETTGGMNTVGLRAPRNEIANALLEYAELPIAAPSANPYQGISPTAAAHVENHFDSGIEWLLDGGQTEVGIESTVVFIEEGKVEVLRPGMITADQLGEVLEPIGVSVDGEVDQSTRRRSPGSDKKHYAPSAKLVVIDSISTIQSRERDGWIIHDREQLDIELTAQKVIDLDSEPDIYGRKLYAALHELDDRGVNRIVVQAPPKNSKWKGIWNRLSKAESS